MQTFATETLAVEAEKKRTCVLERRRGTGTPHVRKVSHLPRYGIPNEVKDP